MRSFTYGLKMRIKNKILRLINYSAKRNLLPLSKTPLLSMAISPPGSENKSQSKQSPSDRFEFLDGYRGFCAIIVCISHMINFYPLTGEFAILTYTGYFIGVAGFFVLSSFLLTYRMMKEFYRENSFLSCISIVIQYAIRRFFRIYIPYFIFCTAVKFGPKYVGGNYNYWGSSGGYNSWYDLVTLNSPGKNHLWTVPIEIKYYYFIPIFCFVCYLFKRFWYVYIFISVALVTYLYSKVISYQPDDVDTNTSNKLIPRFPMFFCGSIVAVLYYHFEKADNTILKKIIFSRIIQFLIFLITLPLGMYGFRFLCTYFNKNLEFYEAGSTPSVYFSGFLFLMLIGAPNPFTQVFSRNYILEFYGKYSFGVYLLHPWCLLVKTYQEFNYVTQTELVFVTLLLSGFAGFVFFYLIENPCMKIGNMFIRLIKRITVFKKEEIIILKKVPK